jgi:hypothetical protein
MPTSIQDLVTAYIEAVGNHRLEALPAMLEPDVEFVVGDTRIRGVEGFVAAFATTSVRSSQMGTRRS